MILRLNSPLRVQKHPFAGSILHSEGPFSTIRIMEGWRSGQVIALGRIPLDPQTGDESIPEVIDELHEIFR